MKLLAALIAAVVIATGGYFGLEFYVQQRVEGEVEAAFAALRATGAKASRGKVGFDLWSRTITVADISGESGAQPPLAVRIGRFTAAGVDQPEAGRFSAERIDAADVEVSATLAAQGGIVLTYKAPRIEVTNYSGPAAPLRPLDSAAPADIFRFVLEHFAAVTAAAATAPAITGTMTAPGAAAGVGDYAYSGVALRDIRDGRIASMTVDRVAFTTTMNNAGKSQKMTGEVAELAASDLDAAATLALLDPARAKDDTYHRACRQMKTGAYTASFEGGPRVRIEGAAIGEIGLRPSRLQLPQLMALIDSAPPPGTTPTQAQMREIFEKAAGIYEGIRVGGAEMRGLGMEMPDGDLKLAAIRLGTLENGRLAEFALEGLDARTPQGPVRIGRVALKALDLANLMRMSAQLASVPSPSPDELLALLLLLEGTELTNLVAPYKRTGQPVNVEALSLSWGQFVGPIPTRARVTLKVSGPIDPADPDPFKALAAAGISNATVIADLGAAWNEDARAFALEPATLEIGGVATAAIRARLDNVARETFSTNPLQAAMMAAQVEAGTLEIALRDTGGVDLAVAQYARTQNVSREAARRALVDAIRANAMQMVSTNPDAMAIAGALARFIENPRGTLSVKLTPRGKVPMMSLIELRDNPLAALARFQVELSSGR